MEKSIIKKLFIKLCKILGYEIIDQNNFTSPTLGKDLNENLSTINKTFGLICEKRSITPLIPKSGEHEDQIAPKEEVARNASTVSIKFGK